MILDCEVSEERFILFFKNKILKEIVSVVLLDLLII